MELIQNTKSLYCFPISVRLFLPSFFNFPRELVSLSLTLCFRFKSQTISIVISPRIVVVSFCMSPYQPMEFQKKHLHSQGKYFFCLKLFLLFLYFDRAPARKLAFKTFFYILKLLLGELKSNSKAQT